MRQLPFLYYPIIVMFRKNDITTATDRYKIFVLPEIDLTAPAVTNTKALLSAVISFFVQ